MIYKRLKQEILERDAYICQYCGKKLSYREAVLDHVKPRASGGEAIAENLVTACKSCNCRKADKTLQQYLLDVIKSNTEYHKTFHESIKNIHIMLDTSMENEIISQAFFRMLYANIVTSMEVYLSDGFINTVMANPALIRRLIESDPEFSKRKFTYSDIYNCMDKLEDAVKEHLLGVIYHNIWAVKKMYESVLNIEFPKSTIQPVNEAVMIRHDIVHRNGKNKKTGEIHVLSKDIIRKCADNMLDFINRIDEQLKENHESKILIALSNE